MYKDDWNKDHIWGQKDVLLRRPNIKKNIDYVTIFQCSLKYVARKIIAIDKVVEENFVDKICCCKGVHKKGLKLLHNSDWTGKLRCRSRTTTPAPQ